MDIFLPELMAAGEAGNACTALIEQAILESGNQMQREGTVVIGTVKGDIHDIGKNIVASLLKAHGYKVIDLGKDVPATRFIDEAEVNHADVIAGSALMSITRAGARDVADSFAYLQANQLDVIDVHDPSAPVEIGGFDTGWGPGIAIQDQIAYIAGWSSGMIILDISNPARPIKLGQFQELVGN